MTELILFLATQKNIEGRKRKLVNIIFFIYYPLSYLLLKIFRDTWRRLITSEQECQPFLVDVPLKDFSYKKFNKYKWAP